MRINIQQTYLNILLFLKQINVLKDSVTYIIGNNHSRYNHFINLQKHLSGNYLLANKPC